MTLLLGPLTAAAVGLAGGTFALLGWRRYNPRCPSCGARKWDRVLCRPLLLCRRCAQRIDRRGRRQN